MIDYASILARKLSALFSQESHRKRAETLLNQYGARPQERDVLRVRLAVLKLSEGDLEKIADNTTRAKQDYRDVLAWAEDPRQSKRWSIPEGPAKERLRKADRHEYDTWLQA